MLSVFACARSVSLTKVSCTKSLEGHVRFSGLVKLQIDRKYTDKAWRSMVSFIACKMASACVQPRAVPELVEYLFRKEAPEMCVLSIMTAEGDVNTAGR